MALQHARRVPRVASATWRRRRGTSRVTRGARTVLGYSCGAKLRNSAFLAASDPAGKKTKRKSLQGFEPGPHALGMRKLNLEIRSLWRTWLDVPRLVELREIGGTYPLGHSDSWLTIFFVAHEVDDRKTQKALKWRARGRHCNPPAGNRPRAFCSRRDDRNGPLTAARRPASRTVQSLGSKKKLTRLRTMRPAPSPDESATRPRVLVPARNGIDIHWHAERKLNRKEITSASRPARSCCPPWAASSASTASVGRSWPSAWPPSSPWRAP